MKHWVRYSVLALSAVLGLSFWVQPTVDPDLGWHLLGGAWIVTHGTVPDHDFINSFNVQWIDYHWLAQVITYFFYKLGGYQLLRVCFGLVVAVFLFQLADLYLKAAEDRPVLLSSVLFIVSALVLVYILTPRPQLLAFVVLTWCFARLKQKSLSGEVIPLGIATIFLANCHVLWVFIPGLWFLYRVLPCILEKRHAELKTRTLQCFSLVLAGAVSPYGLGNFLVILDYALMPPEVSAFVAEFQPSYMFKGFLPFLYVAWAAIFVRKLSLRHFKHDAPEMIIALISFALALRSIKFIPLFLIFGVPCMIQEGSNLISQKISPIVFRRGSATFLLLNLVFIVGILWKTAVTFPLLPGNAFWGITEELYPIQACNAIAQLGLKPRAEEDHVRVLTFFNHGGWCRWSLFLADSGTDYRVTSDGRTQFVPALRLMDTRRIYSLEPGWQEVLHSWKPGVVVVGKNQPLAQQISQDRSWMVFYEDKSFLVAREVEATANVDDVGVPSYSSLVNFHFHQRQKNHLLQKG